MDAGQLKQLFEQQAGQYDQQWQRLRPLQSALFFLVEQCLQQLPKQARLLCVGVGTGEELLYLAERFPHWQFTAVEPAAAMLERCRQKAQAAGVLQRCDLVQGYLHDLPVTASFDAATAFLVSHFLTEPQQRLAFFQQIARRLKPAALLLNADLACVEPALTLQAQISFWQQLMTGQRPDAAKLAQLMQSYRQDVAVSEPSELQWLLRQAGFAQVLPLFQAGLMQAWCAQRAVTECE
ncbi:class I SAM-dependent methyltransferase [Rheinheimera sp.]|uniref:class I SAM-dependent methyltransferase n=1 Tax=Rheinheimera sp. TaxID=1869214 RepID=UPI003AF6A064